MEHRGLHPKYKTEVRNFVPPKYESTKPKYEISYLQSTKVRKYETKVRNFVPPKYESTKFRTSKVRKYEISYLQSTKVRNFVPPKIWKKQEKSQDGFLKESMGKNKKVVFLETFSKQKSEKKSEF